MFKGSLTVATIVGVPVRVHWTFLVLLAWVFGAGVFESGSLAEGLMSLAFITSIFGCVVAHEFGHILAARSFGIRTRSVTLLPIGGVASLERMPEKPWQELAVALAGPLVNVVIAAALLPGLLWREGFDALVTMGQPGSFASNSVASLAAVNVWLVLFNMIPAFPMDGGRVLRAVLAMLMPRSAATRAAAAVGQVLAVAMALVGIFAGMPMLLILSLFVFIGADAEASGTLAMEMLRGVPVRAVMVREFRVLAETDPLQSAVDELLANTQTDFPVTRDGTRGAPIVGLLTRVDLVGALARHGPAAPVSIAMRPSCPPVREDDSAQAAYQNLQAGACPLLPVVDHGVLSGLLTPENIVEAILIRGALDRHSARGPRQRQR